jgi:hypothetical protein
MTSFKKVQYHEDYICYGNVPIVIKQCAAALFCTKWSASMGDCKVVKRLLKAIEDIDGTGLDPVIEVSDGIKYRVSDIMRDAIIYIRCVEARKKFYLTENDDYD